MVFGEDGKDDRKVEINLDFLTGTPPHIVPAPLSRPENIKVPSGGAHLSLTFCHAIRFAGHSGNDVDDEDPNLHQQDEDFDDSTCDGVVLQSVRDYDWADQSLYIEWKLFCALSPWTRHLLCDGSELGHRELVVTEWG